jgi:uncharacterized RDD family membrane protein YckC
MQNAEMHMQGAQSIGAGFGERFVAYLVDAIILAVPNVIVSLLLPQAVGWIVTLAIGIGYFVYFWTTSGSTPGKSLMGLKVVNAETGELIDPGTAVLRYVGYLVSGIALALGFLWIIWDARHQGWHDKMAKTLVVKTK